MGTLFRNMGEDLQTATSTLARGTPQSVAATDAYNQLEMADEYLCELKALADRPIA